jgi:hypothetical protein
MSRSPKQMEVSMWLVLFKTVSPETFKRRQQIASSWNLTLNLISFMQRVLEYMDKIYNAGVSK